tara:strand:+ start:1396 stop:1743 length:348 start_codon:yes stop_codon:yes gene_type:complete
MSEKIERLPMDGDIETVEVEYSKDKWGAVLFHAPLGEGSEMPVAYFTSPLEMRRWVISYFGEVVDNEHLNDNDFFIQGFIPMNNGPSAMRSIFAPEGTSIEEVLKQVKDFEGGNA